MKVLFLNLFDDPAEGGGAEMTLHHLTHGLLRRGLQPIMLSIGAETGLHRADRDGVRIWRAGLRNLYRPDLKHRPHPVARAAWHLFDSYNAPMQPLLRRVLQVEQPDVVSIHNLPGWSAAAWKTIADTGIPSVQVLHDAYSLCPKATMYREGRGNCASQCTGCRLLRLPHRALSRKVRAVVGVSRYILDRHLQAGYFSGVPVQHVIHNARDAAELGVPDAPARTAGPELRIGFIGRLDPTKGVEPLLDAFAAADLPHAELWIAGNGKADYERSLRARHASERVRFLGRVAPRDFYPQVDVVVVPSLWQEPLGMVVAEALAFGKPVIGSRRGGIPEMIRAGENGLLFEPDRPGELVAALRQLAGDATLRARMGEAARASARPFMDRDRWVDQYQTLYQRLARGSSRTAVPAPAVIPEPPNKESP
ncbi:MAG TPA: glycosyltransferase family 4 protein [Candidatus Macondimonas sp.]|nr:glycosyltransferase family 4 protein [Candidatus Macondimonas sp.]